MIESNNEKAFICVSFYTTDEKLCEYENFLGLSWKNLDIWNVCMRYVGKI